MVDGVLYTVQAPNDVVALDAATGRIFWTFGYEPAADARTCCGRVNRGLAILGDTLYMGTIDAHLLAIDAKSGKLVWNTTVDELSAALLDHDVAGRREGQGDRSAPPAATWVFAACIAAFDAKTGKEVWRIHTIPGAGEPGSETWAGDSWKEGGAAVWNAGAYDRETNLVFFGTGNPAPDWDGRGRAGDNLYSDSVLALDADTGKLKWYYQFTPHDEIDYDSTQVPVLADIDVARRRRAS